MNYRKQKQVYKVLICPIQCSRKSNIHIRKVRIYSGQKYTAGLDEDMCDLAIGFYEILYKTLLRGGSILDGSGNLRDKSFAGDTMNSFQTIANLVPEAGHSVKKRTSQENWPQWLQEYFHQYHCLANFWVLPMEVGRTIRNKWCKGCYNNDIKDYMDRFLLRCSEKYSIYRDMYPMYFEEMMTFEEFSRIHQLRDSFISQDFEIQSFSHWNEPQKMIAFIQDAIVKRADIISRSEYAEGLWLYFNKVGLF